MKFYVFLYLILCAPLVFAQSTSPDQRTKDLLCKLDQFVAHKADYHAQRNKQIETLKAQARRAEGIVKVNLYREIYGQYAHYCTDSAQVYLNLLAACPEVKASPTLQAYVHTGQAEICAVAGLYAEANAELEKVDKNVVNKKDPELELFYYRTIRTLFGWMADYTEMPVPHKLYSDKTMQYRDTLLAIESPGESRDIVEADKATATGNPQQAVKILLPLAAKMGKDTPDPYICFTLYQAYHALNNHQEALYYLVLTAIADLQRATMEYQALPILAQELYERGDIERAYKYLICSMEDANQCKAMLRALEVSKIFPIIDRQYKQDEARQHRNERIFTIVLAALIVVLCIVVFYLRKQMKKLHASRRELSLSNQQQAKTNEKLQQTLAQLQSTNETLQETFAALQLTDKVKEEYIARYLNRCRDYLDTMQANQRVLHRLFKERRMDELGAQLKSDATIREEQDKFYADFDAAFLTLFPDFIDKFNALLKPEEKLQPKHEGQLNTELRIFALIRLGITDTQRIAHFLNFSVATVYSYRSKIRNKANGAPTNFEEMVANL